MLGTKGILKLYPDATEADYRQAFADIGASLEEADSFFNMLVAKIGDETILVDAGLRYKPKGGYLLDSMSLAGIEPDEITQVVITHTHADHVFGLVLMDGKQPAFPNATYVISKEEMVFWQKIIDDGAKDQRPIVSMMEAKGIHLIDMDEQIVPGLTAIPIPGHTPGHIALLLESGGEKLIHMADLLHSPIQFAHPEWSPTYDDDTSISVPTRRTALGQVADENLLALFYHLPFPGLGWVKRAGQGEGFTWKPVES